MAKREGRSPDQIIKHLQAELQDREKELQEYRTELGKINRELERFIGQLSGELKLAALIQRSLVPTEIPTIPGFFFSTKFVASPISGGDYFDIFELQDKMKFGILLANPNGHGMASLFLSVLLKLTTQIEAKRGMEPDEVLKHMTKEIQANIKGNEIANVFYAVVDRRHYSIGYCRAGDVRAYVYKYSHDKLVRLDPTQSAIGKNTKATFKVETLNLEPHDKLILASEGIVKARNSQNEAFGESRLHDIILKDPRQGCHDLRNEILFQVSKFSGGQDYPQDLSVLIMEVSDKVIKLKKN